MLTSKKFFVANWKENKTYEEGLSFFREFLKLLTDAPFTDQGVVFCPPYPFLVPFKKELSLYKGNIPVRLGSQDVSQFEQGSYTGEVSARLLKDLVDFSIVGHSERRKYFSETDEEINARIRNCQLVGITPIICVSKESEVATLNINTSERYLLAFEPLNSIGSSHPESLKVVSDFRRCVDYKLTNGAGFLYGGSVDEYNVKSFLGVASVDGVLIGTGSLKLENLYKIVVAL